MAFRASAAALVSHTLSAGALVSSSEILSRTQHGRRVLG
jgi:hypothetical protein